MEILRVKKLTPVAVLPKKAFLSDAAFDLCSAEDAVIPNGQFRNIDTGLALEIPKDYFGFIRPRSGKATKEGLLLRSSCVIDSSYRGPIKIGCYALGVDKLTISTGERIAQLLILPVPSIRVEESQELSETQRGEGGFGSTGTSVVIKSENSQQKIEEIINGFNFKNVATAMRALNWTWLDSLTPPSEDELRIEARRLLEKATQEDGDVDIYTGGFRVQRRDGILSLLFVVEESEVSTTKQS